MRIRELREAVEMTQQQLADNMGVMQNAVARSLPAPGSTAAPAGPVASLSD